MNVYAGDNKKMLNMLILEVLKEYTDAEHRLTQQEIIDLLKLNYGAEQQLVTTEIVALSATAAPFATISAPSKTWATRLPRSGDAIWQSVISMMRSFGC